MRHFINTVKEKAKENPKRIVFPEGFDPRILTATHSILKEGTAIPVLIGDPEALAQKAADLCIDIDWGKIEVINPKTTPLAEPWLGDHPDARDNINTLGTLLVQHGHVDGMISGTTFSTADTIRPALKIIGTKEKFHKVSGFFFMIWDHKVLLFADCAVTIEPNSHDLAGIALDTAETAKRFGLEPRIAMLSFSTNGSAKHPNVSKIREATKIVKEKAPDLIIEGEMQVDAALIPDICLKKFPTCKTPGDFNILIFPDLEAGNIAYKLVQRLAGAHAIGPILQGLKKPINDLSRGCSAQDILDLAAFTTVEAQGMENLPQPQTT